MDEKDTLSHIAWRECFPSSRRRLAFIKQIARRIAEEFHPDKIILFGSQAYGKPKWYSDIDLLVIMPFEGNQLQKSVEILQKLNLLIPIDLLAYTPGQIERRLAVEDFFVREMVEKGKVIYEAAHD
ncbi:MAG: nucleotidyltransferase domain-containing protein [Acidobacteria bacterium]|nr:nucleotidyltransferase domain-containing protein [Acidobacteriota bacterium]